MFAPVEGIPAAEPDRSLVRSALTPTGDGVRWEGGMVWRQERCPAAVGYDPCDSTFGQGAGTADSSLVYYRPVAFRVVDECGTREGREVQDRAVRQARAITSWMVARELQTGTISRANPYVSPNTGGDATGVNAYLQQSTGVALAGTHTPHAGLALVEDAARDAQLGMDAWIHVPVHLSPFIADLVETRGNQLYTRAGSRIVIDSGYTGAGPLTDGTSEVQTVTVTGVPTGGTFTLTYAGQTTAPIAYNATAATVLDRLLALSNISPGDVTVGGGPGPATPWTVTFAADLGNVAQMTDDDSGLTGGTAPAVTVTTTTPGVTPTVTAGDWIYATGPVEVRLSEIVAGNYLDHDLNLYTRTADRLFAARFDPCTLHAVNIVVPEPAA